jgi:osmotically-inducible protein OsmY
MVFKAGLAVAAGAAAVYYLDKQRGVARRHRAIDQATSIVRHQIRHAGQLERRLRGNAEGLAHQLSQQEPVDATDEMLADRVRSEIFRQSGVPRGAINIDSGNGVVTLRGEVDDLEDISSLEMAARKVGGVKDVRNLLHLSSAART